MVKCLLCVGGSATYIITNKRHSPLTLNDAQESTAQVLNITSPQQAQQLSTRLVIPLVHTMATVSPIGPAAVQVRQAPFPTSSPTATAPTLTTSQYLQMMTTHKS